MSIFAKSKFHIFQTHIIVWDSNLIILFPFLQLYIILIRPERNVRQSMMPVRYSAINKNPNSGSTSMMSTVMLTATTCNQKEKIQRHMSIVEASTPAQLPGEFWSPFLLLLLILICSDIVSVKFIILILNLILM